MAVLNGKAGMDGRFYPKDGFEGGPDVILIRIGTVNLTGLYNIHFTRKSTESPCQPMPKKDNLSPPCHSET